MLQLWQTDNRKLSLHVTIKTNGEKLMRCVAADYGKKNSKYADRTIKVNGSRTIYFSFPISPKQVVIGICNHNNKDDKDFEVIIEEKPLKEYEIWLDEDSRDFLPLALYFSQVCGFETAATTGRPFKTNDDRFKIKYFPVIKDYMSGQALSTPARIGHTSGIIETSQMRFDNYTVPMRMIILLHEFSHKYRNPKIGLPISNEFGADINALYIYLGLGFSKVDAIYVFVKVFLRAQTPQNLARMRNIMEYIKKFEAGEIAKQVN
jgi:hypothetical protein